MWFILESLPSMPLTGLYEAGESLIEGLKNMMPDAIIEQSLIGFGINNNN
jgi:DNA/RNA-binding domain of Phe-tRNA-synthetase-like protein